MGWEYKNNNINKKKTTKERHIGQGTKQRFFGEDGKRAKKKKEK